MASSLIALLLLLDGAAVPVDPADVDTLARVVIGEGCALVQPRDLAAVTIVHTLLNHPEREQIGILGVAEKYYHGYEPDGPIALWAHQAADVGLTLYLSGYDMASGSIFVLSRADLERYGAWPPAGASEVFEQGEYGLYFFVSWPL